MEKMKADIYSPWLVNEATQHEIPIFKVEIYDQINNIYVKVRFMTERSNSKQGTQARTDPSTRSYV
jgi:hypothetical protein